MADAKSCDNCGFVAVLTKDSGTVPYGWVRINLVSSGAIVECCSITCVLARVATLLDKVPGLARDTRGPN